MDRMKVMRFDDSVAPPGLIIGTAQVPRPGPGEMLIRVKAAGVTPTELHWYPTTHTKDGAERTGAIPGHEFSGIVEAVGSKVDPGQIGREVFGLNDWYADGAIAQYCLATPLQVATKPARLTHIEAASVPIGALTAWQGLIDRAGLQSGQRALVHGGAGAVGVYAIQLARRAGASVITTASQRSFEFLMGLGADEVIDYHTERFEQRVHAVDVVFDCVGGNTLQRSWDVLKPDGRMITIVSENENTVDVRVKQAFFIVEPNQAELAEAGRLFDAGELRCFVDAVVPFAEASDAYCGKVKGRLGRGKMVVAIP
jgi:NADPH:quinone reductase-like Zn-dependent oxidoreductase